jgi:hypothetical protein
MNSAIWAEIIGAVGVIVAALLTVFLSQDQPVARTTPQGTDGTTPLNSRFTPHTVSAEFSPSGWMGDGEQGDTHLTAKSLSVTIDGISRGAICFTYTRGSKGWAGVYWQFPENNWGSAPGADLRGASKITFFAHGENGGEIVEFISGGIKGNNYSDSYRVSTGKLPLNKQWTEYSLDIEGYDLSSVIGAFAWSAPCSQSGPLEFCVTDAQIQ